MKRIVLALAITAGSLGAFAAPASAAPVLSAPVKAESVWCDGYAFCVGAWWRVPSAIMGRWWMG